MKNIIKKMFIYLVFIVSIGIVAVSMYHYSLTQKEEAILRNKGMMVNIDGQSMNVYREGAGEDTYVFMAGSGIAAPVYELKGLYSKFSQHHQIAVVDRAGYGFSEIAHDERAIDTILMQTREALLASGLQPPYILVPHSISGLEAIYWAQKYPEEVKGIIALDIGLPSQYVKHKMSIFDRWMVKGVSLATSVGLHRLVPSQVYNPQVLNMSFLTTEEKEIYQALSFKQFFNEDMKNELLHVYENSLQSEQLPLPQETPMLIVDAISKENVHSKYTEQNRQDYADFAKQFTHAVVKEVSGTHSIYLYQPDAIYQLAMDFMKTNADERGR
ncbi:alpha/beta hydrolase [Lysinibacillus sphaericus]|uniref:alpha/beta fold hydrolase n=1 Tax=Lysinibacillus sphaericus TaxID=1421 RepID=UPI0025A26941|nr:alpha/beta hydrolase [Lysinibacillus sphaericus]MDM5350211.1 alpha/beta hydrolase [Lysinibacillus sphaericus]